MLDGLFQSLLGNFDGCNQGAFGTAVFFRCLGSADTGQTGNGQDGAFSRLHNSLVGGFHTCVQSSGKADAVSFFLALQRLGKTAEQKGENNAGVASCTTQQGGCGYVGGLGQCHITQLAQLGCGCIQRHGHVCAGITVGNGKHIQIIDLLFVQFN